VNHANQHLRHVCKVFVASKAKGPKHDNGAMTSSLIQE
jgi:hypothetical protein